MPTDLLPSGTFDVAIAGAGLAGSALALRLARGGARVALLDAATFPRDKLCGEYLSPESWSVLDRMDLVDEVVAMQATKDLIEHFDSPGAVFAILFEQLGQEGRRAEPSVLTFFLDKRVTEQRLGLVGMIVIIAGLTLSTRVISESVLQSMRTVWDGWSGQQ